MKLVWLQDPGYQMSLAAGILYKYLDLSKVS